MPLQLPFLKTKCTALFVGWEVVTIIHHCSSVEGEKKPRHLSLSVSTTDVSSASQKHCSLVSWKQCLRYLEAIFLRDDKDLVMILVPV